jgi:hypothetical protein
MAASLGPDISQIGTLEAYVCLSTLETDWRKKMYQSLPLDAL